MDQQSAIAQFDTEADSTPDYVCGTKKVDQGWTEADKKKAVDLFNSGLSMAEVGGHLRRSRNSIGGLFNRIRKTGELVLKAKRVGFAHSTKKKREFGPNPVVVALRQKVQTTTHSKRRRVRLRLIENPNAVTFAELAPHMCKWPMGDPRNSDFRFCGTQRLCDSPYCESHTSLSGRLYTCSKL